MSVDTRPADGPPNVAVVILNWNGWQRTLATLESVDGLAYPALSVLLIDNASTDESVERLRGWLGAREPVQRSRIELVVAESNLGFADGCNLGIERGLRQGADYILLLNNDTVIRANALTQLVHVASKADAAIAGGRLLGVGGEGTKYTGNSWPQQLFFYKGAGEGDPARAWWEYSDCSGAAMLLRRDLLEMRRREQGHFLDGELFMYGEDVDICLWGRSRGFRCVVARDAIVTHAESQSSGGRGSARAYYYITRNRIRLANTWLSWRGRLAFHLYYLPSRLGLAAWRIIGGGAHPWARSGRDYATAMDRAMGNGGDIKNN